MIYLIRWLIRMLRRPTDPVEPPAANPVEAPAAAPRRDEAAARTLGHFVSAENSGGTPRDAGRPGAVRP